MPMGHERRFGKEYILVHFRCENLVNPFGDKSSHGFVACAPLATACQGTTNRRAHVRHPRLPSAHVMGPRKFLVVPAGPMCALRGAGG